MSGAPRKPKNKVAPGKGKATSKNNLFNCSANHISKVCREVAAKGLALRSTTGDTQISTLLKVLQYFGPRGINTYEGTAAGYARIATRIQDLEDRGWLISSLRENLIGPDGLYHGGVARYVLIGRRTDFVNPQGLLELEIQP